MTTIHVRVDRIADATTAGARLDWIGHLNEVVDAIDQSADQIHAASNPGPQSLLLCFEISTDPGTAWALRARLAEFAAAHPECAITWAVVGDAERITPATGGDA